MLPAHLLPTQFCGVRGNTIFEAVATVREVIAQAEVKRIPICVLSLDFRDAFDKVSHRYLFVILKSYGISEWFIDRIRTMYDNASSSVHINGHLAGPIPFQCSIRQ
jgi:hypothetical protein